MWGKGHTMIHVTIFCEIVPRILLRREPNNKGLPATFRLREELQARPTLTHEASFAIGCPPPEFGATDLNQSRLLLGYHLTVPL